MIKRLSLLKHLALLALSCVLSACLGGSVAQQIARSVATSVADNAVANAMDVQEIDTPDKFSRKPKSIILKDTVPDPYRIAFANARFEAVKPIAEPLPEQITETETPVAVAISSQLVRVELFNLLIGDEKAAIYEKAQLMGATSLPKPREWRLWQVATGKISPNTSQSEPPHAIAQSDTKQAHAQMITFLIPPEFGKLPSGSVALVELASAGELNIARYKLQ